MNKTPQKKEIYESPQVKNFNIEVKKPILTGSTTPYTENNSEWD